MWQSILVQASILLVLVAANYHEPISQTVKVEKDGKYETIQINATLAPAWLKDAPTQHKAELKVMRLSGTTQFDYRIDIQQWRLSDQKNSTGFSQSLMNDSMNWSVLEMETAWRAATGSRYFWYRFGSNRCDAILMRIDLLQMNIAPIYFHLTPDFFRISLYFH